MIKCIIVDDEPIARKGMKRLVETRPELDLAGLFGSAREAEAWLADNSVDLVFLDIEMPGVNGMEFARRIPDSCMVIFTTAYSEYAVEGFELEALDYLVKPIDPQRFNKAVDRALAYRALAEKSSAPAEDVDFIIVRADRKYVRLRLDEILYVEGLKDYLVVHLADRNVVTRMTVKAMEESLPAARFLRVNKSYIVNRDRIDSFDNNDVCIGPTEIAIGLAYRDAVLDALLK